MTFILAQSEDLNSFLSTTTLSYLIAFGNIIVWFLLLFLLHFAICEKSRTDITSSSCVVGPLLSFNAVIWMHKHRKQSNARTSSNYSCLSLCLSIVLVSFSTLAHAFTTAFEQKRNNTYLGIHIYELVQTLRTLKKRRQRKGRSEKQVASTKIVW